MGRQPCSPGDISVLVAVKNPRVREAFSAIISAQEGFCVLAEAGTDQETIAAARIHHPILAIVDEDLPAAGGDWTHRTLLAEGTVQAVIALGARGDPQARTRARLAGAAAYLQTNAPPSDIFAALAQATPRSSATRLAVRRLLGQPVTIEQAVRFAAR